jgi:hypothetical protein
MKNVALVLILMVASAGALPAAEPSFPGLKRIMDPATYQRTGVQNLSAEQQTLLDAAIRDYVVGREKDVAATAAARAVDAAVKERKVQPPDLIESRIVGDYTGYGVRTVFRLANGQTWKPTDGDVKSQARVAAPAVVIYKDFFGYKMFVEGAGIVRVKRVN